MSRWLLHSYTEIAPRMKYRDRTGDEGGSEGRAALTAGVSGTRPGGTRGRRTSHATEDRMPAPDEHIYKILELVGSSEKGIEDAIQNAISRASKTIREMKWFEVVQMRGHVEGGTIRHYQVTLRVGFTLE